MSSFKKETVLFLVFSLVVSYGLSANRLDTLSSIEKKAAAEGLEEFGLEVVKSPSGKTIGQIYIFTKSPFIKEDGFMTLFNLAHVNTLERVLRERFPVKEGDVYTEDLILQAEQVLLDPMIRSFVTVLPVQKIGALPRNQLDLLVISRDIFSLRLSQDFNLVGANLTSLVLNLSENNLFGSNKTLGLSFNLDPYTWELGAFYVDPLFVFPKHELRLTQSVIFGRKDNKYAGLRGKVRFEKPLYTQKDKWGYVFEAKYTYAPKVFFKDDKVRRVLIETIQGTEETDYKYRNFESLNRLVFTRSFGQRFKNDWSFGYGVNIYRPSVYENHNLSSEALGKYIEERLPVQEIESFFIMGYHNFENSYFTLRNYKTYVFSEIIRKGFDFSETLHLSSGEYAFGDHVFIRPITKLQYTQAIFADTGFLRLALTHETRFSRARAFGDSQASVVARVVSPSLYGAGRLVLKASIASIYFDRRNRVFALGGDNGVRGTVPKLYLGKNLLNANAEIRSSSFKLFFLQIGGVAFYDVGSAFEKFSQIDRPTHSLGAGLRVLIVPWNRRVLRLDLAIPIEGPQTGFHAASISFGFGQGF